MCEGSGQLLWDWPRCGALLPAENEVKENRMRKGALPLAELQQNAQSIINKKIEFKGTYVATVAKDIKQLVR